MMSTWVVVTDSRRARVFESSAADPALKEIKDLLNPLSHQQVPDERGQGAAGRSGTQHGLESRTQPKQHDAQQFVHEISSFLHKEHAANHFKDLLLVAAPEWVGHLQQALHDSVKAVMQKPVQKDLVHCTPAELLEQIKAFLKPH